jgi:hypothetical protein
MTEGTGTDSKLIKTGQVKVWAVCIGIDADKVWALYNGDPASGTLIMEFTAAGASVPYSLSFPFGLHFQDSLWVTGTNAGGSISIAYS